MARDPKRRSRASAVLAELGEHNVYWHAAGRRDDVIGLLPLASIGLAVTDLLARRFGSDPDRGADACAAEAASRSSAPVRRATRSAGERLAFERWAPLVMLLPGLARWSAAEKRALVQVIRAKGGVRESDFVRAFDAHARLRSAVAELARRTPA